MELRINHVRFSRARPVSINMVANICKAEIAPAFLSDHSLPWIIIKSTKDKRGKGFLRFNTSLLQDKEFYDGVRTLIQEIKLNTEEIVGKWEWFKYKFKR